MCAILEFLCKVLKKRGKVLKMCVSSCKKTVYFNFIIYVFFYLQCASMFIKLYFNPLFLLHKYTIKIICILKYILSSSQNDSVNMSIFFSSLTS